MKDKSIKQPWPRSTKITVWVLSILLFLASVYIALDATTVKSEDYITDGGDIHRTDLFPLKLPDPKQDPTKTIREL